jgi:hypothetical protein
MNLVTSNLSDVQNLIASWWFDYDQGNFDVWPNYFTEDAHFSCRSDSKATSFEEFVTAEANGRDAVVAWNIEHRKQSPYPLRHNGTNVHVIAGDRESCTFRSYIFVTQIVGASVAPLASGICLGSSRHENDRWKLADLRLMLDFADSGVFSAATQYVFE